MRKRDGGSASAPNIQALEMMLDYAIMEGAELRLPLFVLLLRTARLELMAGIDAAGRRRKAKVKDQSVAAEVRSLAAPVLQRWIDSSGEVPEGRLPLIQDR